MAYALWINSSLTHFYACIAYTTVLKHKSLWFGSWRKRRLLLEGAGAMALSFRFCFFLKKEDYFSLFLPQRICTYDRDDSGTGG